MHIYAVEKERHLCYNRKAGGENLQMYNIGYYIQRIREEKNINQRDLCRGICDRTTLSRIENGKQEPSYHVLKALLQRLDVDETQVLLLLGPQDFEISNLQKEITALNTNRNFQEAAEKIRRLEEISDPADKIIQQFILRSKALAHYGDDFPASRALLTEALQQTHPDFDFDKINEYLLSIEEMKILNQIAISYSEDGDRRYGIHIYRQLFQYLDGRLMNTEMESVVQPMLAYNYSKLLGQERRYEECIEIATLGYETCVKYNKCRSMGGLLLNLGYALHNLGRDTEAREKLIDSYYAYRLMRNFKSCEVVLGYAKEALGEKLF